MRRLIFFEGIFFDLDEDSSLFLDGSECEKLLSFTALDLDPNARSAVLDKYDSNLDRRLNRVEFCRLCEHHLWDVPTSTIEAAVKNMKAANRALPKRNKTYWTRMSRDVEHRSRSVIPFLYFLSLIVIFNIELYDHYFDDPTVPMFSGIGPMRLTTKGVVLLVLYITFNIGFWYASVHMNSAATAASLQQSAAVKEAARFAAAAWRTKSKKVPSVVPRQGKGSNQTHVELGSMLPEVIAESPGPRRSEAL